jgi:hydroxyethylthiazole kinase
MTAGMDRTELAGLLEGIHSKRPLVHHITNYVTVNDCANATLCIGASPVMAHSMEEVAEMVSMAGALVINIGTLDAGQVEAMLLAGKTANRLGIPIVLDPVGAGATAYRTRTSLKLLERLDIAVLKGNGGEIGVLAGAGGKVRGVDSAGVGGEPVAVVLALAGRLGITVAMTGAVDIVSDGKRTLLVENGHPLMGRFSGSGCIAASIVGAFVAVGRDRLSSTAAALAAFGIAGERAAADHPEPYGFRLAIFDELCRLTPKALASGARIRKG